MACSTRRHQHAEANTIVENVTLPDNMDSHPAVLSVCLDREKLVAETVGTVAVIVISEAAQRDWKPDDFREKHARGQESQNRRCLLSR